MPLYDFRCRGCGKVFEARAGFEEEVPCPVCAAPGAERLLGEFAGPFTTAMRGYAARRSDATRATREEQRRERKEVRAERRRENGP
jgi:putative FmdB family regulatory protein